MLVYYFVGGLESDLLVSFEAVANYLGRDLEGGEGALIHLLSTSR